MKNFDDTARAISEEQWQLRLKHERKVRLITNAIIGAAIAVFIALTAGAVYFGWLR